MNDVQLFFVNNFSPSSVQQACCPTHPFGLANQPTRALPYLPPPAKPTLDVCRLRLAPTPSSPPPPLPQRPAPLFPLLPAPFTHVTEAFKLHSSIECLNTLRSLALLLRPYKRNRCLARLPRRIDSHATQHCISFTPPRARTCPNELH
jgi:hypothetical protein